MPLNPLTGQTTQEDEQRRQQRRAQQAQATTNSTPTARQSQQFSQPAGGNFQAQAPRPTGVTGATAARPAAARAPEVPVPGGYAPAAPAAPTATNQQQPWWESTGIPAGATPAPGGWTQQIPMPGVTPTPYSPPAAGQPNYGNPVTNPVLPGTAGPTFHQGGNEGMGQTQPVGPPQQLPQPSTGVNQYGTQANLDPAYIRQQVLSAFQRRGGAAPTEQDIQYWVNKALTPDIYSDNQVRVGWNPYWEDRLITGRDSSDPRLAGTEGLIANPGQYGLNIQTAPNGNQVATWIPGWESYMSGGAAPAAPAPTATPLPSPQAGTPATFTPPPTPSYPTEQPPRTATTQASTYSGVAPQVPVPSGSALPPIAAPTPQAAPGLPPAATAPVAQAPTPTAPVAMPQYQQYQYTLPSVTPGQTPTFEAPDVSGLTGLAQQLAQQGAGVTVPNYNAGTISQFQGGSGNALLAQAAQTLGQAGALATPDTAGLKESAKDALLAQRQQQQDAIRASTAGRGVGPVQQAALEAQLGDDFTGNLVSAYRDIDQTAQQNAFSNLLGLGSAQAGLGEATGANVRSDFATTVAAQQQQEALAQAEAALGLQAGSLSAQLQNQQFGQTTNLANLLQNLSSNTFGNQLAGSGQAFGQQIAAGQLGLQGQQLQAGENAAANQSAQTAAQFLANQLAQQGQLGLGYAQLGQQGAQFNASAQNTAAQLAAQLGLNYAQLNQNDRQFFTQLAQQQGQFLMGQQSQANQFNASQQQQAEQFAAQMGLNYAQLNQDERQFLASQAQQNSQFGAQLNQQAAQHAAQMGFNYAQLSQQDKQFFNQLALQQAIASNNANNDFIRTLLGSI